MYSKQEINENDGAGVAHVANKQPFQHEETSLEIKSNSSCKLIAIDLNASKFSHLGDNACECEKNEGLTEDNSNLSVVTMRKGSDKNVPYTSSIGMNAEYDAQSTPSEANALSDNGYIEFSVNQRNFFSSKTLKNRLKYDQLAIKKLSDYNAAQSLEDCDALLENLCASDFDAFATPTPFCSDSCINESTASTMGGTPSFESPPLPNVLGGICLFFLSVSPDNCSELTNKAIALGACVSDDLNASVTHMLVTSPRNEDWDILGKKLNKLIEDHNIDFELHCLYPKQPGLGSFMIANFDFGDDVTWRKSMYIISDGWIEDSLLLEHRPSEANYISTFLCQSKAAMVSEAMVKMLRNNYLSIEGSRDDTNSSTFGSLEISQELNNVTASKETTGAFVSFLEKERSCPIKNLSVPKVGDLVESKSVHVDAQIFKARVLKRWRCNGSWMFRLKSPDLGAAYNEPLKNVRLNNAWSTAQLLDICQGRKSRREKRPISSCIGKLDDKRLCSGENKKLCLDTGSKGFTKVSGVKLSGCDDVNQRILLESTSATAGNYASKAMMNYDGKDSIEIQILPLSLPEIRSEITEQLLGIAELMAPSFLPCSP